MKGALKKIAIILLIVFAVSFVMIAAYAFIPDAKAGMDYYLGPTGQNFANMIGSTWLNWTTSTAWLTYIAPNILWIGLAGGVFITVLVLNPLKDGLTGWFASRHKVSLPTSSGNVGMLASSDIRATTPAGATTRPTITEALPEVKKEETQA